MAASPHLLGGQDHHNNGALDRPASSAARPYTPQQLEDKPLPSLPNLPSPTLTNPDMVLPDLGDLPPMPSPDRRVRPPSISYLKDITNEDAGMRQQHGPKKEKRGLMSRKMMLLRGRTHSNGLPQAQSPSSTLDQDAQAGAMASSPTTQETVPSGVDWATNANRQSVSSFNSDDFAAIPAFLSRYRSGDGTEDEYTDSESPAAQKKMGYSVSIAGGADAQRKAQEEDEQNSAMLSRRAEQILANAKKRLNLMEGNLRGARDLVAPLTAANLKRATSLGSSHMSPGSSYATRRFQAEGMDSPTQPRRTLHAQASSPTMGRDYHAHYRGHSETQVPERPRTALARQENLVRSGRIPVRPNNEASWTVGLRGVRSSESLGSSPYQTMPKEAKRSRGSPDPALEPLEEVDDFQDASSTRNSMRPESGLGIARSPSAADDLREQMSSLKGRISSLRDRTKEDSLRRQSMMNLREVSPLNNAEHQAPEMWYSSSPTPKTADGGDGGIDDERENTPSTPRAPQQVMEYATLKTGSRNAFAEAAGLHNQNNVHGSFDFRNSGEEQDALQVPVNSSHKRTASGTSIIGSAAHRYSHHGAENEIMPKSYLNGEASGHSEVSEFDEPANSDYASDVLPLPSDESFEPASESLDTDVESVYEDAEPELPTASNFVPHEQRADAFDYENFFLHSAMTMYHRSSSPARSDTSIGSASTAKGPTATSREIDAADNELNPPPTPETPEALREIERKLNHSRTYSEDSISTLASFATAPSISTSPTPKPAKSMPRPNDLSWPIPNTIPSTKAHHASRPSTASAKDPSPRTDSGFALPSRPHTSASMSRPSALSPRMLSPPMSPTLASPSQDPTAVAVNALLDPQGQPLGLKDKAVVFAVVENLRKVVAGLQEGGGGGAAGGAEGRRRLEEARRALGGL